MKFLQSLEYSLSCRDCHYYGCVDQRRDREGRIHTDCLEYLGVFGKAGTLEPCRGDFASIFIASGGVELV